MLDGREISRVYETVLYGHDLPSLARFYADVVGLRLLGEIGGLGASFRLADGGLLLLFDPELSSAPGRLVPSHGAAGPGHVAFSVQPGELDRWVDALRESGVEIEREVTWDEGGRSLYVRDPAGNSVELVDGEAWPA